jgi:6-methylsalicylate decarboxylase
VPTVDVHQHFWPERFVAALAQRRTPPRLDGSALVLEEGRYPVDLGAHDAAARLDSLDRDGIDIAVLSLQPTLGIGGLPPAERDELQALWEESALELVSESGGRFVALAPGHVSPGFVGSIVSASAMRDVDDLSALLGQLDASGGFLLVHPAAAELTSGAPGWWPAILDYTSQMQAAYLTWLSYAQRLWPDVNVVFAILAGGGPFQLERLASRGVDVRSGLHANVFFETASYGRRAIELCIETFGVHQLLYGSDVPVIDAAPTLSAIRGFGDSVVKLITADNPTRLLP